MNVGKIPEIQALQSGGALIRIPNQIDIPITARVRRLIDTAAFQRLSQISQLGVVRFVYPAAIHTRFEHSLGVYRNALLFLQHLATVDSFRSSISDRQATILILAALLHDVGHWPFCHPIEDMCLEGIPSHESFAAEHLRSLEISTLLSVDWDVTPEEVLSVIERHQTDLPNRILCSVLSGPIDIDKMDYLYRDSLHAGVPYGQNFDTGRLIRSLTLNSAGDKLAITRKGRTAAELMVFARYVMFSEVYWHHAVRSATAMFQRAFFLWHQRQHSEPDEGRHAINQLFQLDESAMIAQLIKDAKLQVGPKADPPGSEFDLLDSLFGSRRRLFKRIANYEMDQNEALYSSIAQRPYPWLIACSHRVAEGLAKELNHPVTGNEVLVDAPPVGLEVQFDVDVYDPASQLYRKLGDVSPVVKTLATRQFDDFVKQVRVFVSPSIRELLQQRFDHASLVRRVSQLLQDAVESLGT